MQKKESRAPFGEKDSSTEEVQIVTWSAEALCLPLQKILPQDYDWYDRRGKSGDEGTPGKVHLFLLGCLDTSKIILYIRTCTDQSMNFWGAFENRKLNFSVAMMITGTCISEEGEKCT